MVYIMIAGRAHGWHLIQMFGIGQELIMVISNKV